MRTTVMWKSCTGALEQAGEAMNIDSGGAELL